MPAATQHTELGDPPELPFCRFRARFVVLADFEIRGSIGPALRGVFGHALRAVVCFRHHETDCHTCFANATCPYPALFETRATPAAIAARISPPPPWAITRIDPAGDIALTQGDFVTVDFIIVGSAITQYTTVVAALRTIERFSFANTGALRLVALDDLTDQRNRLSETAGVGRPRVVVAMPSDLSEEFYDVRIDFVSPLSLETFGKPIRHPSLTDIAAAAARRVLRLDNAYGSGRLPVAELEALAVCIGNAASAAKCVAATYRIADFSRTSSKQQARVLVEAVEGGGAWVGVPRDVVPWLASGALFGIGYGCVMGLGRYDISLNAADQDDEAIETGDEADGVA